MTWRFRRRFRLGPGLHLNVGKNGPTSISFGRPGATLNVPLTRPGAPRATVGLPGTGFSWSEEIGRPSSGQRRQAQRGSAGQPTTQQLVDLLEEAFVGPDGAGDTLWHQHGRGLVSVLLERDDTPRPVLEACALVASYDRCELHVRRGRGPADSLQRTRQVLEAAQRVIQHGREIGLVVD